MTKLVFKTLPSSRSSTRRTRHTSHGIATGPRLDRHHAGTLDVRLYRPEKRCRWIEVTNASHHAALRFC